MLETADEVCGWTKGRARRGTTWWWDEEVRGAVREKRRKFRLMLQKNTEESKYVYRAAKKEVRKEVTRAMGDATKKVREKLEGTTKMAEEG